MVMVTRSASRKASESFSSDLSDKNNIPPWCSSGTAYERRKQRKVTQCMKSFCPLRENIWEYLNNDKADFDIVERKSKKNIKTQTTRNRLKNGHIKLLILLMLTLGIIIILHLTHDKISEADLIAKILPNTNFISFDSTSVGEECCHRIRHLALALKRAEQALSKARRIHKTTSLMQNLDAGTQQTKTRNKKIIEATKVYKGSNTVVWETRAALWGVVPLWRVAPPPDLVLSLRPPVPSDCWPIRGSYGEIIIELPGKMRVDLISLEHIHPDTAYSAPKNFTVYGVLTNGTWIKAADGIYKYNKAAKQYFYLDNENSPLLQVVFRVLSNHGNPKYTCIYRLRLYSSI